MCQSGARTSDGVGRWQSSPNIVAPERLVHSATPRLLELCEELQALVVRHLHVEPARRDCGADSSHDVLNGADGRQGAPPALHAGFFCICNATT